MGCRAIKKFGKGNSIRDQLFANPGFRPPWHLPHIYTYTYTYTCTRIVAILAAHLNFARPLTLSSSPFASCVCCTFYLI